MLLEIKDLHVCYGKKTVLENVSVSVNQGEIYAILGGNGAGKTTLFRTIMGFLKHDRGQILIDGIELSQLPRKKISQIIAYVPQCHNCTYSFPVIDVVVMGTNPHLGVFSEPSQKHYRYAKESLEKLKIGHLANRPFKKLSGGEKQLVLIARALVQNPKLIIMDEPTASLDFNNSVNVLSQIINLKDENLAVLVTCHSPSQVQAFADKVLMIKNGTVFKNAEVDILNNQDILHQLYSIQMDDINDQRIIKYITKSA